ncbi:hypothetical protein Nmel_011797 [Mimus melanotis]
MDARSPRAAESVLWSGLPALHGIAGACVDCAKMGNKPALLLLSIYAGGQLWLFGSSEVKQSSLFFRWLLWQG